MMIKAVIFDFSGVIATEAFLTWLAENISDFEQRKKFFLEIADKVDRGQITDKEFVNILGKETGKNEKVIWPEIFKKVVVNPGMIKLLSKLRKNYKVALLTNHIAEWITYIIRCHNLASYFDEIIISSMEKVIKPESQIFNIALGRLKVKPWEAIFIDDRQKNVDGAAEVGIRSMLYVSDAKLKNDLRHLGVKV
jgi:epoxide hydrolase-like predicted phosphatase